MYGGMGSYDVFIRVAFRCSNMDMSKVGVGVDVSSIRRLGW